MTQNTLQLCSPDVQRIEPDKTQNRIPDFLLKHNAYYGPSPRFIKHKSYSVLNQILEDYPISKLTSKPSTVKQVFNMWSCVFVMQVTVVGRTVLTLRSGKHDVRYRNESAFEIAPKTWGAESKWQQRDQMGTTLIDKINAIPGTSQNDTRTRAWPYRFFLLRTREQFSSSSTRRFLLLCFAFVIVAQFKNALTSSSKNKILSCSVPAFTDCTKISKSLTKKTQHWAREE